ncbi:CHC2 zinc finger domain-containing protein [Clostridium sp.]|uniref:CHC2 zinc finger domain-containing protein n=1 Tax=Clostridium sp. TaxID=1506 RepID=UPI001A5FEB4D|nr:CHC2 zinc finger domain-containing protein [Clostridium sp.]MBK5234067.1 toprim domain-containing protein [Clostridium sp.]
MTNSGSVLLKVLWYYNLIPNNNQAEYKIVCPFHDDVNPSMACDILNNFYLCFGCNASGNAQKFVIDFEKKYNGLSDLKALVKYHEILKSDKCSDIKLSKNYKTKVKDTQLYAEAYDYYHGLKNIDWMIDYTFDEVQHSRGYMEARGFSKKTLNRCKAKVTFNKKYPIIFPMMDNGKFKGWVCRTDSPTIEKKRKYLYNTGFSRATTLVGNYKNAKILYIVEGYMDRLKLKQFGCKNVVAILGWKVSQQQINKINEANVEIIISALDNDISGKKGNKYLKEMFGDKVIRFSFLSGIKDPGDMTKINFKKMNEKTLKKIEEKK